MPEQTLKEKTAKGLFWGGISNGLQQILGLVFGIVLARILSPEDYGMVGMLAIFTGIASSIIDSGFATALINKKEFRHEDYNAVFWFSIAAGVILYVILFFCAPLIAWFYNKPELTNLSRLVFLGFLFAGAGVAHNAILFKNLMVKERAKIDVIALLVSGIVGLFMALNGFAYWGLAVQGTAYISVGTLLRWYYSPWRPTFQFSMQPLKEMLGFSSKLFLTNIFWQISSNQFSVLLGKFYNAQQVGYYSQGYKWMVMGNSFVGGMINGVAQPVFAEVQDDLVKQQAVFRKIVRFGAFVSFPLMLGLAFVSKEFILIAVGEKWLPSVPFLQLFCLWGSVAYLWTLYTNILMVHGKSNIYMWGMIIIGLSQITIVALAFSFGIMWMVTAYILSFFLGLLGWHYFVNKLIGLRLLSIFKDIFPYSLIIAVSFSSTWLITSRIENIYILLVAKIILTAIIYLSILWSSNSVVFKECIQFLKKENR